MSGSINYRQINAQKNLDEKLDLLQNRYLKQIESLDFNQKDLEEFWWAKEKKIG